MSEYNDPSKQPELYEHIGAETRFVLIAKSILENKGESPDGNERIIVASWPQKPQGYYFRLQGNGVFTAFQVPRYFYTLEHHLTGMPADKPMTKYVISVGTDGSMSGISVLDAEGASKIRGKDKSEEKALKRRHLKELLGILTDADPVAAKNALSQLFGQRFEGLVGAYVLSDLTLEGAQIDISEAEAIAATERFVETTAAIKAKVLKKSRQHDSPARQSFIEEAVMVRRERTNKNQYAEVDVLEATKRVAREILYQYGRKWKHTVTPDQ